MGKGWVFFLLSLQFLHSLLFRLFLFLSSSSLCCSSSPSVSCSFSPRSCSPSCSLQSSLSPSLSFYPDLSSVSSSVWSLSFFPSFHSPSDVTKLGSLLPSRTILVRPPSCCHSFPRRKDVMLLYGDATPSEAAFRARSVPGGGVGEGRTSVGGSLRAPMIRVPQTGVWMSSHTSAPSCMASVSRKELLHTKGAERGFLEGARGHNSLARRCGEVPGILESPFLFFTLLPASLSSPCTRH